MTTKPLWSAQKAAIGFALHRPATMLSMDMGTGKTRVAIELIKAWPVIRNVLVVCPKSVVQVWPTEIIKYTTPGEFKVLAPTGTVKCRAAAIRSFIDAGGPKNIVVINYDVVWMRVLLDELRRLPWDVVILDESHRAKSAGSKTSRTCHMLGKRARYRLCLSGTPMANSPLDVYGQYRFLDSSIFGTRHDDFLGRYAIMGGPERNFIVGIKNREELGTKFNQIAYQCKKSDMIDELDMLDEPEVELRVGYLSALARKAYDIMNKEFIAEWNQGIMMAGNVLIKLLRLQQITSGFAEIFDALGQEHHLQVVDTAKLEMLKELGDDLPPDEPVVVFYKFKQDAAQTSDAFRGKREVFELSGRINQLAQWNEFPNGVLAVQYQSGNAGIDLTHASYAVFFSESLSLFEYQQAQARLYRPGQTKPVTLIHLLIDKTIDAQIYRSLERKEDIVKDVASKGLSSQSLDWSNYT